MTSKVEIVVSAKDEASAKLKAVASGFSNIASQVTGLLTSDAIQNIGRQIVQFAKDSIAATVQYANEVRRLSDLTGESAEETSRMIQVLDDFKISTSELTPVLNAMRNQGLTPTIETLASLSDEYNSLKTAQEKNVFLTEKFGRAWQKMPEIMSMGGDAIRDMADAVDEALILTEENLQATRQYELAWDQLNDTILSVKVTLGNELIPVINDTIAAEQDHANAMRELTKDGNMTWTMLSRVELQATKEYQAALAAASANRKNAEALWETANSAGEAATAMADAQTSAENLSQLKFILDFQLQTENFEEKKGRLVAEMEDLKNKILDLRALISAGEADEGAESDIDAMLDDYVGLKNELKETEAAFRKWQKTTVFGLLQAKLAADGLDDAEFDALLAAGEAMGIIDPEIAKTAQDLNKAISTVQTKGLDQAVKDIEYILSQDGQTVTIYIDQVTTERTGTGESGTGESGTGKAGGGSFTVPMGYPNDSYTLGLTSGEMVTVQTPAQMATNGMGGVQNHYYYGAKILLERGAEGEILSSLLE